MAGQTVVLRGPNQRARAHMLIDAAPQDAVLNIRASKRSTEQNALLWALISEVSRAKPNGRVHTPEVWKCLFMQAAGHAVQFESGLQDGSPFPVGFRSSRMTVAEMRELIDFIYAWGAQNGVAFTDARAAA